MNFAKTSRRRLIGFLVVLGAVSLYAVTAVALHLSHRAEITGDTPAKRAASIGRLADEQPRGTSSVIAAAATNEPNQEVRRAAVMALRKFAAEHRKTVETATRDKSDLVRAAAAGTLGKLADEPAARRLGEMLNGDEEDSVRTAAASALAGNKTPGATILLVRAMEGHGDMEVRDHATAALIHNFGLVRIKASPRAVARYRRQKRAEWVDLIESIRMIPAIQAAFAKINEPLVLHPERLIPRPNKHICHPEDKTPRRKRGSESR